MRISVVIPAYNAEAYIGETLESVACQTLPPERVIVVDDGSGDATADIVQKNFPWVTYISVENGGTAQARLVGIAECETDWIALCDSDDVWREDHLMRKQNLLRLFPDSDLLFSNCYSFGPRSKVGHHLLSEAPNGWFDRYVLEQEEDFFRLGSPYPAILKFNPAYVSGLAFRRSSYERMGGFLAKYSRWKGEDSEFVRRFSALPNVIFAGDMCPTWGYRRHGGNKSRVRWERFYCKPVILQEHLDVGVVPEDFREDVAEEIELSLVDAFNMAYWDGCCEAVIDIYKKLQPSSRTIRSWAKAAICRMRLWLRHRQ